MCGVRIETRSGPHTVHNSVARATCHDGKNDRTDDEHEAQRKDDSVDDRADLRGVTSTRQIRRNVERGAEVLSLSRHVVRPDPHAAGQEEATEDEAHEGEDTNGRGVRTDLPERGVQRVGLAVRTLRGSLGAWP